ncbi:maestro heat-like repeat-containing protein family member 1, partial [Saccostrea cucullata]|uniref:maestro heat-like repeat-containing protein family member 1 n=1 Tax=Saccostrea cuccullata TaxID=36930 RepID=UPI002ED31D0E
MVPSGDDLIQSPSGLQGHNDRGPPHTQREAGQGEIPNILFSVINDLSKVIAKKMPSAQLQNFLEVLQEGLLDPQSHSSSGACVVLNGLLKTRGAEILSQISGKMVDNIVTSLHSKLASIDFTQTRTGTLRSIRTLATHHLSSVLKTLMNYQLPYDRFAQNLIDSLIDLMLKHWSASPCLVELTEKRLNQ